jgi:hypothetical protein
MRRSAYIKSLEQACALPETIPELVNYFKNHYNPRLCALNEIKRAARVDVDLFDGELIDILEWGTPREAVRHV